MTDSDKENSTGSESYDFLESGFSIPIESGTIDTFMEEGDFSSAAQLDHFETVASHIERDLKEGAGFSLLALSIHDDTVARDFSVLQIAHSLAKHDKKVLIVDCDFLNPGLSGLVEDVEEYGFLDLLLYGSSLKSVSKDIGIDGVNVIGPGSFPVSRTIPFALKEFAKVNEFLHEKSDVVIYCSTMYTEEGEINPLCKEVDRVFLGCRIEKFDEGELKKHVDALKSFGVQSVDVLLIGAEGKSDREATEAPAEREEPTEEATTGETESEVPYLEKTEEVVSVEEERHSNLPRIVTITVAVLIVAFLSWWFFMNRSIREKESSQRMTELVHKQMESHGASVKKEEHVSAVDTTGESRAPAETNVSEAKKTQTTSAMGKTSSKRAEEGVVSKLVEKKSTSEPKTTEESEVKRNYYYAVHVASFKDLERAGKEVEFLEKKGFEAHVIEVTVKEERWFRVLVGEYATKKEADSTRIRLLSLSRIGYARVLKEKYSD